MRTMKTTQYTTWIFLTTLLFAGTASLAQAIPEPEAGNDPQPVIADTINQLIDRLEENREKIKQDDSIAYSISNELIAPHIDFPRIARLVVGKYWRNATDAQRKRLIEEIKTLLTRSYVTAMTSYVDEIIDHKDSIKYQPSRYKPGDRKASVRATIEIDKGKTVDVQYQVYLNDGKWKIYDIRIEGISLAITYRTSFGETIRREGIDSLIAQLEERNRKGEVELPASVSAPFKDQTGSANP
ncbi:phospholipid transport system substrate-binding protein [Thiogranum longum]|uniref:Phospholipid transport system substrate-binding protein n=1 Tax=Thiogranum longum TaxID=1537524 RepID=A0A4R1H661_9GAMM|nr:ABC transporter substrate-binding protein [Thiogranum longum]TCK17227.1 phospholipid transport system substrate-binding protein [Thiogranum longum]